MTRGIWLAVALLALAVSADGRGGARLPPRPEMG